jgi:hypothetical protein
MSSHNYVLHKANRGCSDHDTLVVQSVKPVISPLLPKDCAKLYRTYRDILEGSRSSLELGSETRDESRRTNQLRLLCKPHGLPEKKSRVGYGPRPQPCAPFRRRTVGRKEREKGLDKKTRISVKGRSHSLSTQKSTDFFQTSAGSGQAQAMPTLYWNIKCSNNIFECMYGVSTLQVQSTKGSR